MNSETSKLKIKKCVSDDIWDDFIYSSENKNFLSLSSLINSSKTKCIKYLIYKEKEIVASFHIYIKDKKITSGGQLYTPINYKLNYNSNKSSEYYKKFLILEKFINFLTKNYNYGEITLDYFSEDLRPLMWNNFNNSKKIFEIMEIKYTSVINLSNANKFDNYEDLEKSTFYTLLSRSIKQQYKNSKKENLDFQESKNFKYAQEIMYITFKRQNNKVDKSLNFYEKNFSKYHEKKQLKLFYTLKKNKVLSFTLFGVVGDSAKYLHGGRLLNDNKDYSLTYNMISSILNLKKNNINFIDLEGVNSPKRGFWKLVFGGDIKPYYKFKLNKN